MSVEENLRVVQEQNEAINARDWNRFFGTFAEGVVTHDSSLQEPLKGIEAYRAWVTPLFEAFGDFRVGIVNSFGQSDWVAAEYETEMTHTGTLVSPDGSEIPPTNKTVKVLSVDVFKIEGGKITEQHGYSDQLGFMAQLGLVPENK